MQAELNDTSSPAEIDGDKEAENVDFSADLDDGNPAEAALFEGVEVPDVFESEAVFKARQALVEARQALADAERASGLSRPKKSNASSKTSQGAVAARLPRRRKTDTRLAKTLQFTSSVCAVAGGVLVSSNTAVSKYGFILLACSSSQIFLSSSMLKDKSLMFYSASLFIFVDCLGIYRWLLQ